MLSIAVLTNEVCTAWSHAFFVLASNGTTVWLRVVYMVFDPSRVTPKYFGWAYSPVLSCFIPLLVIVLSLCFLYEK